MLRTKFEWDGYSLNDVSQRILECAVEADSDFIVTADKDLLRLERYEGIEVVKAMDFLQRVLGR